jgi:hypothetical protein
MAIVYAIEYRPHKPAVQALPESVSLDLAARPRSLGAYAFPVGEGGCGPVWVSFAEQRHKRLHVLVGGATGSGKSTWTHAMLQALLWDNGPERLRLGIIDPKRVEFSLYDKLPHLVRPVAWTLEEAEELMACVFSEIESRQAPFLARGVQNLEDYNNAVPAAEQLPYWVIAIDEFIELAAQAAKYGGQFQRNLCQLTSLAGSFGIKLVLSCTYPKSELLDTIVRANCSVLVCFNVLRPLQRTLILGEYDADAPPPRVPAGIPGRCVARILDRFHLLQGYAVSSEDLRCWLGHWGALPTVDDFERRRMAEPPLLLSGVELQAESANGETEGASAVNSNARQNVASTRKQFTSAEIAEAAAFWDGRGREGIQALCNMWRNSGRTLGTPAAYRLVELAERYLAEHERQVVEDIVLVSGKST